MPVKPIPEGYHSVTPYLIIRGAAEAIDERSGTRRDAIQGQLQIAASAISTTELGEGTFAAAWAAGEKLTFDEAIVMAKDEAAHIAASETPAGQDGPGR